MFLLCVSLLVVKIHFRCIVAWHSHAIETYIVAHHSCFPAVTCITRTSPTPQVTMFISCSGAAGWFVAMGTIVWSRSCHPHSFGVRICPIHSWICKYTLQGCWRAATLVGRILDSWKEVLSDVLARPRLYATCLYLFRVANLSAHYSASINLSAAEVTSSWLLDARTNMSIRGWRSRFVGANFTTLHFPWL